jgi:TRAP-type mannitol/chloroaromatic compound transport system permease large subunit
VPAACAAGLPGWPTGALLFVMLFVFVLGFFLDFVEISVIVLPLMAPSLILMGHDPIWLGILLAINLQTSFLTPPLRFLALLPARRRPARDPDRTDLQGRRAPS